jgi:sRNA-binding regulator protein Hfq
MGSKVYVGDTRNYLFIRDDGTGMIQSLRKNAGTTRQALARGLVMQGVTVGFVDDFVVSVNMSKEMKVVYRNVLKTLRELSISKKFAQAKLIGQCKDITEYLDRGLSSANKVLGDGNVLLTWNDTNEFCVIEIVRYYIRGGGRLYVEIQRTKGEYLFKVLDIFYSYVVKNKADGKLDLNVNDLSSYATGIGFNDFDVKRVVNLTVEQCKGLNVKADEIDKVYFLHNDGILLNIILQYKTASGGVTWFGLIDQSGGTLDFGSRVEASDYVFIMQDKIKVGRALYTLGENIWDVTEVIKRYM